MLLVPLAAEPGRRARAHQYFNMRSTGSPTLSPDGSTPLFSERPGPEVGITRGARFSGAAHSFEDRVTFASWRPRETHLFRKDSGGD